MASARITRAQRGVAVSEAAALLTPGTLDRGERARLIEGFEAAIGGVYTHLPLKRARYGIDPVQRLRILRTQIDSLTDDQFHAELADVLGRLRDAHTLYVGPTVLSGKVAALPFMVEMFGATVDLPEQFGAADDFIERAHPEAAQYVAYFLGDEAHQVDDLLR